MPMDSAFSFFPSKSYIRNHSDAMPSSTQLLEDAWLIGGTPASEAEGQGQSQVPSVKESLVAGPWRATANQNSSLPN